MSKGTRHLRVHYVVSNDLGLWWCGRRLGWLPLEDKPKEVGASNQRRFKTISKALGHLICMGKGFTVTRFNPHCGWRRQFYKSGTWETHQQWEANNPGLGMKIVKEFKHCKQCEGYGYMREVVFAPRCDKCNGTGLRS